MTQIVPHSRNDNIYGKTSAFGDARNSLQQNIDLAPKLEASPPPRQANRKLISARLENMRKLSELIRDPATSNTLRRKREASQVADEVASPNHLRSFEDLINATFKKSGIIDEGARLYFLALASSLKVFDLKQVFTHPDIRNALDLVNVFDWHFKSGIIRRFEPTDIIRNRLSGSTHLTDKEQQCLEILGLIHYFWKFYQEHDLAEIPEIPNLIGYLGDVKPIVGTRFNSSLLHGIKFQARTSAVVQALVTNGETLSEKGKDSQGKNIFTGIAFHKLSLSNGARKGADDLANDPLIKNLPWLAGCSRQEIKGIIQAALRELNQDGEYMIGSVEHSMASTVILYCRMWGRKVPRDLGNKTRLMAEFQGICEEYEKRKTNSGELQYNPWDYAALHLAHAMEVEDVLKQEIISKKRAKISDAQEQIQESDREDLSIDEFYMALRNNFGQAIDAEYGFGIATKPTKDQFIINFLKRKTGWPEERIKNEKRQVVYLDTYGRRGARKRYKNQTLFEEFLDRANNYYYKWPNPGYSYDRGQERLALMRLAVGRRTVRINAGMELEKEDENYNRALPSRALGTARMNLWKQDKAWTKKNIDAEVARLIADHKVETQEEFERKKERVELRRLIESLLVPGLNHLDEAIVAFQNGNSGEGMLDLLKGWATFWGTVVLGATMGGGAASRATEGRASTIESAALSPRKQACAAVADNLLHGFSAHTEELGVPEMQRKLLDNTPSWLIRSESWPSNRAEFKNLQIGETREYLHPIKNEKYTVAWVRSFDQNANQKLQLCLLKRRMGTRRSFIQLDWQTGDPIAAWKTIYQQEDGIYVSGGLRGGKPKKAPRKKNAQATQGSPSGPDRQLLSEAFPDAAAFAPGTERTFITLFDLPKMAKERNWRIDIPMLSKFTKMGDEDVQKELRAIESEIQKAINRKEQSANIEALLDRKITLTSMHCQRRLQAIKQSLPFIDFPWDRDEEMALSENESKIFQLEKSIDPNAEKDLENTLLDTINILSKKNWTLLTDAQYLDSLKEVQKCTNYIEKLFQLWERMSPVDIDMDPYKSITTIRNTGSVGRSLAYLREFLKRDLEEADQLRASPTPRNEQNRVLIYSYEVSAYKMREERKKLLDELRNSPFVRLIMQFFQLRGNKVIQKENLSATIEATLVYLEQRGTAKDMYELTQTLDFLIDCSRYEEDFRPMAQALIRDARKQTPESFTDPTMETTMVDTLIDLQVDIKKLRELAAEPDSTENSLKKVAILQKLMKRESVQKLCAAFELGVVAYISLTEKIAEIRNPERKMVGGSQAIEEAIRAEERELLPDGKILGRRMQMHIHQRTYSSVFERYQVLADSDRSESAAMSLEIEQDLLGSKALQERVEKLKQVENLVSEEEIAEDAYSSDELPDSEEDQQRWIQLYRDKLQREAGKKPETPRPPRREQPTTETPGASVRPKPTSGWTEIDEKIRRWVCLYFWKDLSEGLKTRGILGIEVETESTHRFFLSIRELIHILKRHYAPVFDVSLAKHQNTLLDLGIGVLEIIPMFKKLGNTMNMKQVNAHLAKMKENPNGFVRSKIKASYKGKPYWVCVENNRVKTIYPENGVQAGTSSS